MNSALEYEYSEVGNKGMWILWPRPAKRRCCTERERRRKVRKSDYSANADAIDDNTKGVSSMVNWDAGRVSRRSNTEDLARSPVPPHLQS